MPTKWTIKKDEDVTGGKDKTDLVGCQIEINGTSYEFVDKNNNVLATTPGTALPSLPFSFPSFSLDGYTWTITVNTLTGGASSDKAEGSWTNNDPSLAADESGTWTAQAGATVDEEADAAGASA